jgi:signal transduction histidine kinase
MFSPSIETDGAQQRFVSVALELQRWLAPHRELSGDARGELEGVLTELRTGLAELRGLARGLHPAVLTDRGLERALTTLADHATVPVELPRPRLAMSVEAAAYFTVCEALTNVAKHARATRACPAPARSYERGCQSTDRTRAEYRIHVKAGLFI